MRFPALVGSPTAAVRSSSASAAPPPPVADFTVDDATITAGDSATFTDTSTGTPTSWLWEKNDGGGWVNFAGTPTAQNPTETFTLGTWSIRLTATNAGGSDGETKTDYIVAVPAAPTSPVATPASDTEISFDWTSPAGTVTQTDVRWSDTSADGPWTTETATAKPFALTGQTANAQRWFQSRATVGGLTSDWSESLYAWTLPAAPTGLNQTGADTSSITVDWTDTNPAPLQGWSYRYSTVAADGPWTNVDEPTGKPVTIGGFSPETTVYVQARAVSGIEFGSGLPGSYSESLMCTTSSP